MSNSHVPQASLPTDTADLTATANAAFKARDYRAALAAYEQLSAQEEDAQTQARWLLQRSICQMRLGHPDPAVVLLAGAATLAPQDGRIRYKFGIALSRVFRPAEAREQFQAAVELAPEVAEHHFRLALALREAADEDGAVAALQQCLRLRPDHPAALEVVANPLSAQEKAWIIVKAGKIAWAKGDYREALALFGRARALTPGSSFLSALIARAESYRPPRSTAAKWRFTWGSRRRAARSSRSLRS